MTNPQDRKAKAQAAAGTSGRGANAIIVGGLVFIVVMVLVVGGAIWSTTRDGGGGGGGSAGAQKLPTGVKSGEPLEPYADANPPKDAPVVDIYEDFRCPICQVFEQAGGDTVTELAQDGKIRLRVHLKTVIDANTGGNSSAVAGSSAVCALEQGAWTEYHKELFARQPAQETEEGFPEGAYTEAAKAAGLSGEDLKAWQECTDDQRYVDYVKSVDDASSKEGINGTPVIAVEGTKLDWTGLTDGKSADTFDTEKFAKILTSGEVPKDLVQKQ